MVRDDSKNGKISTIAADSNDALGPADFEKAITATGFGKFNLLLFLAALPIGWAGIFDTTTGAFILASAECDLHLTFFRKGVLVAFPYIGMVLTSFLWEYITPYTGMRTLFVLSMLADSLLNILSSSVDSYYIFLLIKFLAGILAGGPLAMVMPYLSEFHASKYKPSYIRWAGFVLVVANMVPAAIGFSVLPLPWSFVIFGREYNAWRIYILICSIVPVVGLVTSCMLPDSPKYLMEIGRPEEALRLLRTMYWLNTGKPANTFPIKALLARRKAELSRPLLKVCSEKIRVSWYNTKLLFSTAYLPAVFYLCFLQFGSMLGFNVMRLWVPHLFIILNNFDAERWAPDGRAPTICEMLDRRAALPARAHLDCPNFEDTCIDWVIRPVIYQNSTTIASSAILFSFVLGFLTTTRCRKKIVIISAFLISVLSSFGINWAQAPPYMLTLGAAIIVTGRIAGNIVTAVNADVIPIPLRATSINLLTFVGNMAAIIGNFVFSGLLGLECLSAYIGMGCLFVACVCLSIFHPKPPRAPAKNLGNGA